MTALAVTAVTNFILACETFLFTGMLVKTERTSRSAAWFWTWALGLLGLGALLGGIDHGFVEPLGGAARYLLQRVNWLVLGGATFCVLMTTSSLWPASSFSTWVGCGSRSTESRNSFRSRRIAKCGG